MMLFEGLQWWYGAAWKQAWQNVPRRATNVLDAFSVKLLARTLFSPFRQIDAGGVRGSLDIQVRAWFDRTFSRVFGFFVRSIMIIAGCIAAAGTIIVGVMWAVIWIFIPLLPIGGVLLTLAGRTLL